jgi:hypothetical protein
VKPLSVLQELKRLSTRSVPRNTESSISRRHFDLFIGWAGEDKGRGVFAGRPFYSGEVIEVCPLILLKKNHRLLEETELNSYVYAYNKHLALALGYGSLYNHADKPNAWFDRLESEISIIANRNIQVNDEITIDYGSEYWE